MTSHPTPATEVPPVVVSDMRGSAPLMIERRHEPGLSQTDLDDATGWADGYTAELEAGYRCFGQVSLPEVLSALGVRMEVRLVTDASARVV